jgi:hypothetical protein
MTTTTAPRRSLLGAVSLLALGAIAGPPLVAQLGGVQGIRSGVESLFRNVTQNWTPEACSADQVGCLRFQQARLGQTLGAIDSAIAQLRPASEAMHEAIRQQEMRLAQNELLLREGRALVQRSIEPSAPIRFVGETYPDRDALTRQLRVLFAEGEQIGRFLAAAREQQQAVRARHDEVLVSRGEVRAALSTLPAQIELARAGQVLGDVAIAMRGISTTVALAERRTTGLDALMRTTEELMRDGQRAPAAPASLAIAPSSSGAFEAFLRARN